MFMRQCDKFMYFCQDGFSAENRFVHHSAKLACVLVWQFSSQNISRYQRYTLIFG